MLLFGNFVFAYRTLSRIKDAAKFRKAISEAAKDTASELEWFRQRQRKLLEIDPIDKGQTPFVGYLSANEVRADLRRCELLRAADDETGPAATWDQYLGQVRAMANPKEVGSLEAIVGNYQAQNADAAVSAFSRFEVDVGADIKRTHFRRRCRQAER